MREQYRDNAGIIRAWTFAPQRGLSHSDAFRFWPKRGCDYCSCISRVSQKCHSRINLALFPHYSRIILALFSHFECFSGPRRGFSHFGCCGAVTQTGFLHFGCCELVTHMWILAFWRFPLLTQTWILAFWRFSLMSQTRTLAF